VPRIAKASPKQEQSRDQFFLVELPERDQHGCVEHADAAGCMAGEAEQSG
jgi:hypothetical protein